MASIELDITGEYSQSDIKLFIEESMKECNWIDNDVSSDEIKTGYYTSPVSSELHFAKYDINIDTYEYAEKLFEELKEKTIESFPKCTLHLVTFFGFDDGFAKYELKYIDGVANILKTDFFPDYETCRCDECPEEDDDGNEKGCLDDISASDILCLDNLMNAENYKVTCPDCGKTFGLDDLLGMLNPDGEYEYIFYQD